MSEEGGNPAKLPAVVKKKNASPFKSGFVPNGRRRKKDSGFMTKKGLLKMMLEIDITVGDLPVRMADHIRQKLPGFLENVDRRFTMLQVIELMQIQLVFSKSDYVKQNAIDAIKDRVYGKAKQTIALEPSEVEETEIKLSNGRTITI